MSEENLFVRLNRPWISAPWSLDGETTRHPTIGLHGIGKLQFVPLEGLEGALPSKLPSTMRLVACSPLFYEAAEKVVRAYEAGDSTEAMRGASVMALKIILEAANPDREI